MEYSFCRHLRHRDDRPLQPLSLGFVSIAMSPPKLTSQEDVAMDKLLKKGKSVDRLLLAACRPPPAARHWPPAALAAFLSA